MRVFLIILDSVGIGDAPDSEKYGDAGANTLAHTASSVGGLSLPVLGKLGLGNIPALLPCGIPIAGVPPENSPAASFGAMRPASAGKDTTTGHWEMAGIVLSRPFHLFPPAFPSFPDALVNEFVRRTGRGILGNCAASGTEIIARLGARQMETGAWIVYTSADSVFQIAAHENVIPLEELYRGCAVARELCNSLHVGRVIARPYVGCPGSFKRTQNRRDFSIPLPGPTILDRLSQNGERVTTVGKLDDIFDGHGITRSIHVENNIDAQAALLGLAETMDTGLVFANLIDFDMLYGHRRDPRGYANALETTDRFLGEILPLLNGPDCLIVTADHGNDPTFPGTDHTREFVPLVVFEPGRRGRSIGIRNGFHDVAQSLAMRFGLAPLPSGISFLV